MGFFFGQNRVISSIPTSNIKYGRLYNWYTATDALLAPTGWHVPTMVEFSTLITTLNAIESGTAAKQAKSIGTTYWLSGNEGTNSSGLDIRGNGCRVSGDFSYSLQGGANLHSTDTFPSQPTQCYILYAQSNRNYFSTYGWPKNYGAGIRLIADSDPGVTQLTDLDENIYDIVLVGAQYWLVQNWACTKLNNGTTIPNVTDATDWSNLSTLAYCNYDNDVSYVFL
jgi:uncharacterized protein (TIGR02145 family)